MSYVCAYDLLEVGVAQLGHRAAHAFQLRGLRVVDLHDRAAGEFDRQVEAARDDEEHRRQERDQADDVQHQRVAHERYGAMDAEEFHVSPCFLSMRCRAGWPPGRVSFPWVSRWCRWKRSEEHTSELQSLMRISYAVFCLKKKKKTTN